MRLGKSKRGDFPALSLATGHLPFGTKFTARCIAVFFNPALWTYSTDNSWFRRSCMLSSIPALCVPPASSTLHPLVWQPKMSTECDVESAWLRTTVSFSPSSLCLGFCGQQGTVLRSQCSRVPAQPWENPSHLGPRVRPGHHSCPQRRLILSLSLSLLHTHWVATLLTTGETPSETNSVVCFSLSTPIYIPTNSVGGFPFLHILSSIYCL